MRKILFIGFTLIIASLWLAGQNLVPNPSFETITGCPPGNSGLGNGFCPPWVKPPGSGTTPDLFHACSSAGTACGNCNVPNNFGGISNAWHGVAYAGIITYYTFCPNCREYIQVPLTSPLVAGNAYQIRFRAKLGSRNRYGTDRIGFIVSNTAISQPGNQPITLAPTYEHPGQILDKVNWTLVNTTYVASGGESFLTIGNFRANAQTNVFDFGASGGSCALATAGGTYYFDSVFVGIAVVLPAQNLELATTEMGRNALISWKDQSSIPPQGYVLEHALPEGQFSALEEVEGKLHLNAEYEFLHESPQNGVHYYRLKSIDIEGNKTYSEIKELTIGAPKAILEMFPNPANHKLSLRLQLEAKGQIKGIYLLNGLGQIVYADRNKVKNDRQFERELNLEGLAPGVYLLRVNLNDQVINRRLVIE